ncbi:MAG: cupin domain-containing protein [Actinomycetota bacterium]
MSDIIDARAVELRFGDWGPGYLVEREDAAFGVVVLRPGDDFANHLHEHHTESFFCLEGSVEVWLDRAEPVTLARDQLVQASPKVEHYLRNVGQVDARLLFVKSPGIPGDKVARDWAPNSN